MKEYYVTALELAQVLKISPASAYKAVANMNDELKRNGYQVFPGRVPLAYITQKYYGLTEEVFENGISKINS